MYALCWLAAVWRNFAQGGKPGYMDFPDVLRTICGTTTRTDFCKHSLTSAGKGIIDGSGHFSFLTTVILGRFL